MTALKNGTTRDKHTTHLCPQLFFFHSLLSLPIHSTLSPLLALLFLSKFDLVTPLPQPYLSNDTNLPPFRRKTKFVQLVCLEHHFHPSMPQKNPAPRYFDLQVSQVMCIWFGLNKMYANMYVNVCSSHTGCEKLLRGMVNSWQNFYFDGQIRYRKSKRYHDDRRAKYSHKQTCYLPGVSPPGFKPGISSRGLFNELVC